MEFTIQNALILSSVLYLFGLLVVLFIIIKYKNELPGLFNFGYYFLFNAIGIGLMAHRESLPMIFTIILANFLILLATMSLSKGIFTFHGKRIPYVQYLVLLMCSLIGLTIFTYLEFNLSNRMLISGIIILFLHIQILRVLFAKIKVNNAQMDLLSVVVLLSAVAQFIRIFLLILFPINEPFYELDNISAYGIILSGIAGFTIATGVLSLINNALIREAKDAKKIYSNFINSAPIPAMVHASDGELLYLSETFTEITGYNKNELKTMNNWIDLAYSSDRGLVQNIIKDLYKFKYKKNYNTIEILTKSQEKRLWSFSSAYLGKLSDGRDSAMSVAVDITESNKQQLEVLNLQQKNEKLLEANRIAVDLADMLVWRTYYDENSKEDHTFVVEKYANLMGWDIDKDGLIKQNEFFKSFSKDIDGELTDHKFADMQAKVHNNQINEYVLYNCKHINRKSGESIYLEHHAKVEERHIDGSVKTIGGYAIDVTLSMEKEKELKFEQEKAQTYLDIIGNIIVALDHHGNITLLNNKGCEILEVSENEVIGLNWIDNFIPEDIKIEVKKVFEDVFNDKVELEKQYENMIVTKSGKEILVNWFNSILHDIEGNIIGVISSGDDITEKSKYQENLREIGYRDTLTGLYNRRYYEEELDRLDIESNYPITIAMGDINGLKLINDAFGHNAGDNLLVSASEVIQENCREYDLVARIGGDEFVIVMIKTSEIKAEKIIELIHEKSKLIKIESIELSISFGIKTKHSNSESIQEIYRSAEDLMYREKLLEIPSMRSGAIETILNTLYEKDKNSEIHSRTVSIISEKLAKAYGMSRQEIAEVKTAGLLHDIGKIIIPLPIINKEGKLTQSEYVTIKTHSEIGFRILNSTSNMRSISNIVLCHHERWDGTGYPRGIKGEKIPLMARIISIADAFDAMTSVRTYKNIVTYDQALKEIILCSGSQFDPDLCKVFEENFATISREIDDTKEG